MIRSRHLVALAASVVTISVVIATQNHSAMRRAGMTISWRDLFVGELPLWLGWALLLPAITAVSRRFPLPGSWRHWLVHFAAAAVSIFSLLLFLVAARRLLGLPRQLVGDAFWPTVVDGFLGYFATFLPFYATIVAAERAYSHARHARERDLRASRLEALLHQAQLERLRSQLHPHFLFNALHAISALMGRDVRTARRMMAQLSELLRLSLEGDDEHLVPLGRELELLAIYVALQEARFGDRLRVEVDAPPAAREIPVPRLVLQPLVENSVHHALELRRSPCRVEVTARLVDDRLALRVCDDGPGFHGEVREGIGLGNTRQRLAALYGDAASFAVTNGESGGAEVTIELPLVPPSRPDGERERREER